MGLGYDELSAVNPRLIYVTLTGYGCDGPDSQRPGYDVIISAEAGLMSITGALIIENVNLFFLIE